jgi:hypothetical protein
MSAFALGFACEADKTQTKCTGFALIATNPDFFDSYLTIITFIDIAGMIYRKIGQPMSLITFSIYFQLSFLKHFRYYQLS